MGSDIDDLLDDVIDDGVDVAFALKVLLWWNGLCDDDEACFDIIVGDVIGTFGVSVNLDFAWVWFNVNSISGNLPPLLRNDYI